MVSLIFRDVEKFQGAFVNLIYILQETFAEGERLVLRKAKIIKEPRAIDAIHTPFKYLFVDSMNGRTLLGMIMVNGTYWMELVILSLSCQQMLFEKAVLACVPTTHEWLRKYPLSVELVKKLRKQRMFSYCNYNLMFLHVKVFNGVFDHLSGVGQSKFF